jgi:hypothetical protein
MRALIAIILIIVSGCKFIYNEHRETSVGYIENSNDLKHNVWIIPANKSYLEPYRDNEKGISHDQGGSDNNTQIDVEHWTSPDVSLNWYLKFEKGKYDINLEARSGSGESSKYLLSVKGIWNKGFYSESKILLNGTDDYVLYSNLLTVDIPENGFYKVTLKPLEKSGEKFVSLRNIVFSGSDENINNYVRYANWLSSPSVYLFMNKGKKGFDWIYGKILVPEGEDPVNTFYMGLGFFRGYFGIQVNSLTERRILFSVWDSSNEPISRKLVKEEDKVLFVDKGENVIAQEFENQGTGGQSIRKYDWKAGAPVELLLNLKQLKNNYILLSAWFRQKNAGLKKWQYVASWKAPKDNRYFEYIYSYIDNFNPVTGQYHRKALFYDFFGRNVKNGEWEGYTKATVTFTDGEDTSREDVGSGIGKVEEKDAFYLWSGGYEKQNIIKELEMKHPGSNGPDVNVDSLDRIIVRKIK